MIRSILTWPDRTLKQKSQSIDIFNGSIKELERDLIETCQFNKGAGLAAIQIGIPSRAMVVLVETELVFMADPVIDERFGEEKLMEEGCLSFPGIFELVKRFEGVSAYFKDSGGTPRHIKCSGLAAHAIYHEIDHLAGVVMPERMDTYRRQLFLKKYKESHKSSK